MTTPKRPRDPNQLAKFIVDVATGEAEDTPTPCEAPGKVKRGSAGGRTRAIRLSSEERSDAARKAVQARWSKT